MFSTAHMDGLSTFLASGKIKADSCGGLVSCALLRPWVLYQGDLASDKHKFMQRLIFSNTEDIASKPNFVGSTQLKKYNQTRLNKQANKIKSPDFKSVKGCRPMSMTWLYTWLNDLAEKQVLIILLIVVG